ncbi:hypothetical protein ABTY53_23570 [Streptomyces noursei]|uniref:hypothetical protein n=1 Tax=Streptomyces noursei TaxID=1971 RepID=UPI00332FCEBA
MSITSQPHAEPEPTARGGRGTRTGHPSPTPDAVAPAEAPAPTASEAPVVPAEAPAAPAVSKPAVTARPAPRSAAALIFDDPLSQQSSDDTDRGWGERATSTDSAADLARFLDEKPPHHL